MVRAALKWLSSLRRCKFLNDKTRETLKQACATLRTHLRSQVQGPRQVMEVHRTRPIRDPGELHCRPKRRFL